MTYSLCSKSFVSSITISNLECTTFTHQPRRSNRIEQIVVVFYLPSNGTPAPVTSSIYEHIYSGS